MPLTLNCPKCKKPFRIRDESMGQKVRCPHCSAVLQVPNNISPSSFGGTESPRSQSEIDVSSGTGDSRPNQPPLVSPTRSIQEMNISGPTYQAMDEPDTMNRDFPSSSASSTPETSEPAKKKLSPMSKKGASQEPPKPKQNSPLPASPAGPISARELNPVRGGLRWMQFAFFFGMIPGIAFFAEIATFSMMGNPFADQPGVTQIPKLGLYEEIQIAAYAIPAVLSLLMLFIGRAKIMGAPSETFAKGLAKCSFFFTFLAILGGAILAAIHYLPIYTDVLKDYEQHLPLIHKITVLATIWFALIAEISYLLFLGQIGWSVGNPSMQGLVNGTFMLVITMPIAWLIAYEFVPQFLDINKISGELAKLGRTEESEPVLKQMIIACSIFVIGIIMIGLRWMTVTGKARKSIVRYQREAPPMMR